MITLPHGTRSAGRIEQAVPDLDTAQRRATTNVTLMPAGGTGPGDGHGENDKEK